MPFDIPSDPTIEPQYYIHPHLQAKGMEIQRNAEDATDEPRRSLDSEAEEPTRTDTGPVGNATNPAALRRTSQDTPRSLLAGKEQRALSIVVDGPISAGKSVLVDGLISRGYPGVLEPLVVWEELLVRFYAGEKEATFQL
jgi:hypothetical protein